MPPLTRWADGGTMRAVKVSPTMNTLAFRSMVLAYYAENARDLPWRRTEDPYRILVSEIMLQQTQVSRVLTKYDSFLAAFPDVTVLASAPLRAVLELWQGLGYNRRAVALHKAARIIGEEYGGLIPQSLAELTRLPGVGAATAGAISVFAFNVPVAFVETNIRTVFLHHYFPDQSAVPDREILPLIEATLDRTDPRRWFYALMDYGVALKAGVSNPSRRSSHYARQSPFPGSRRELRAQVLRVVLSQDRVTVEDITAEISGGDTPRVAEALEGLTNEGFLVCAAGRYSVA